MPITIQSCTFELLENSLLNPVERNSILQPTGNERERKMCNFLLIAFPFSNGIQRGRTGYYLK